MKKEKEMNRVRSKYYTNKSIKTRIDKILELNATYCANLGTKTPLDRGTKEAVEKKWVEMAQKIFELDPEFYLSVMKNTDGNFIRNYKGHPA
jgi:hypothetical protein